MADAFDRIGRIRGSQPQPRQTSNDAQFEAYRAAVNAANQASQPQGPPQGWRQANGVERFLHGTAQFGESLGDIFGSREAWEELKQARQEGNGVIGAALNWLPRFAADLPGNMASIPFMAPEKLGEVVSGSPMQEIQNGYMPDYTLDTEQRLATLGDVGIDLLGLAFGGSGTALRAGGRLARSIGRETAADALASTRTAMNGMSKPGRVAWDVTEEAGEEFAQQYLQEIRGDQEKHGIDSLDENTLDHALEGAFLGAVGGGIFSGGGLALDYAVDKANKYAARTRRAGDGPETVPDYDMFTSALNKDPGNSEYDSNYMAKEAAKRAAELEAQNQFKAPGRTVSLLMPTTAKIGRAENVGMRGLLSSMIISSDKGIEAQNSIFNAFGIADQETRSRVLKDVETGAWGDLQSIFDNALKAKHANGEEVELVIWKYPSHNGGKYTIAVDSINMGTGVSVDVQMEKRLNMDADGDQVIISFLQEDYNNAPRGIFHLTDAVGEPMVNLEQMGILHRGWKGDANPVKFIKDYIEEHNRQAAANPNGIMKRFTAAEEQDMLNAANAMKNCFNNDSTEEEFAEAFKKFMRVVRDGGAYKNGDNVPKYVSDQAAARDLSAIMEQMINVSNPFTVTYPSVKMPNETEEEFEKRLDEKADRDSTLIVELEDNNREDRREKNRVIDAGSTYLKSSVVTLYHIMQGFGWTLRNGKSNPVFRNVFPIIQSRHGLIIEGAKNVIDNLVLAQMEIHMRGQDKIDQLNSVFNNLVISQVMAKLGNEMSFDFGPDFDWDRFFEVFRNEYNNMVDMFNESALTWIEGRPEEDQREFMKSRIGKGFTEYDALLLVWGDYRPKYNENSLTQGLTLREFLMQSGRDSSDNGVSFKTFAERRMESVATRTQIEGMNKVYYEIQKAWLAKRRSIYGDTGALVNHLSKLGNQAVWDYYTKYNKDRDNMSSAELHALYTEAVKILDYLMSIVGVDVFVQGENAILTGIDFVNSELFETFIRPVEKGGDTALGRQRADILCCLVMQNKFSQEIYAFNDIKSKLQGKKLSDATERRNAIDFAVKQTELICTSMASKVGFNNLHWLIYNETKRNLEELKSLGDDASADTVAKKINELDMFLKVACGMDSKIGYESRRLALDNAVKNTSIEFVWTEDMLSVPNSSVGELGIGNKFKKALTYYSESGKHECAIHRNNLNDAKAFRDNLKKDNAKLKPQWERGSIITNLREICATAAKQDIDILVSAQLDAELVSVSQGEKATSELRSSLWSQAQTYVHSQYHTSYMNNATSRTRRKIIYQLSEALNNQAIMVELILGTEPGQDEGWLIEDSLNGKGATLFTCKMFYEQALPDKQAEIDAATDRNGHFEPTPELLADMLEKYPHLTSAISPYTVSIGMDANGDYQVGKNPTYDSICKMLDGFDPNEDNVLLSKEDIVWNWVSSSPMLMALTESMISAEVRVGSVGELYDSRMAAMRSAKKKLTNIFLHAYNIRDDEARLNNFLEKTANDMLGSSIDQLRNDLVDKLSIEQGIENAINAVVGLARESIKSTADVQASSSIAGVTTDSNASVDDIKKAIGSINSGEIDKVISSLQNYIMEGIATYWAINAYCGNMTELFGLNADQIPRKLTSAAARTEFAKALKDQYPSMSDDDIKDIIENTKLNKIDAMFGKVFDNEMANILAGKDVFSEEYKNNQGRLSSLISTKKSLDGSIDVKGFYKNRLKDIDPMFKQMNRTMNYDRLSQVFKDSAKHLQEMIDDFADPNKQVNYKIKDIIEVAKTLDHQFEIDIPRSIVNDYMSQSELLKIDGEAVWYANEIKNWMIGIYDFVEKNLTDQEKSFLEKQTDIPTEEQCKWTDPLYLFDPLSISAGSTSTNFAQRSSNAIRTGIEGSFPMRYASFMFFYKTPNSIVLQNLSSAELGAFASKSLDNPSDNLSDDERQSITVKKSDMYTVKVVVDSVAREFFNNIPKSKKDGSMYELSANDLQDILRIKAHKRNEPLNMTFVVSGANPGEITKLISDFANEARILKTAKSPLSMTSVMGTALSPADKYRAEDLELVKGGADNDIISWNNVLGKYNDFLLGYGNAVLGWSSLSKIDKSSPLLKSIWVLKHFAPSAKLTLSDGREFIVSYEQIQTAAHIKYNISCPELKNSALVQEPGKLFVWTTGEDGANVLTEININDIAKINVDIKSADSVALRNTNIAYRLASEYSSFSREKQKALGSASKYIEDNFAASYIDWSNESTQRVSADDFARAILPPTCKMQTSIPTNYAGNRYVRMMNMYLGDSSTEGELSEGMTDTGLFNNVWDIKEVLGLISPSTEYAKHMGSCVTVITRDTGKIASKLNTGAVEMYRAKLKDMYVQHHGAKADLNRDIAVSYNKFNDKDYCIPPCTAVILDYAPDSWEDLKPIIEKCHASHSNIVCTDVVADKIKELLGSQKAGRFPYSTYKKEDGIHIGSQNYNQIFDINTVWNYLRPGGLYSIDAGMTLLEDRTHAEDKTALYKSVHTNRKFVGITIPGRDTLGIGDSGGIMTRAMTRFMKSATMLFTNTYEVNKTDMSLLRKTTSADLQLLKDNIDLIQNSIDKKDLKSFNNLKFKVDGKEYVINLSGVYGDTKIDIDSALVRVAEYLIKAPDKRKLVMQDQVFTIAKSVNSNGITVFYPIAATGTLPHEGLELDASDTVEYSLKGVTMNAHYTIDNNRSGVSDSEWAAEANGNGIYMKMFHLRVLAKNVVQAVSGSIGGKIGGKDIPMVSIIDGNSSATRLCPGPARDQVTALALFDAWCRLSGYNAKKWSPDGGITTVESTIGVDRLPYGVTPEDFQLMMAASVKIGEDIKNKWRTIMASGAHFVVAGDNTEYDSGNYEARRFDEVTRKLVNECLRAGINPAVLFNPTDSEGNWRGLDSPNMHTVFDMTFMALDDMFFFYNYISNTGAHTIDGKLFCVPSRNDLFDPESGGLDNNSKQYMFDGDMRYWEDIKGINGCNEKMLLMLASTEVTNDRPVDNLGNISMEASANAQLEMATTWRTGRGDFDKHARRLFQNENGMTRETMKNLIAHHSLRGLTLEEYDKEGVDSDLPQKKRNARPINHADYIISDEIVDPFSVSRTYWSRKMLAKFEQIKEKVRLFRSAPSIYVELQTEEDRDKTMSQDKAMTNYYRRLLTALGAKDTEVSWHDVCLLVMWEMGWSPDFSTEKDSMFLRPIPQKEFEAAIERIEDSCQNNDGNILEAKVFPAAVGTGQRYTLGIGTQEIAEILSKCTNAYVQCNGSNKQKAIESLIMDRDVIYKAMDTISPLHAMTGSDAKGQFVALMDMITIVRLASGEDPDYIINEYSGREHLEEDLIEKEFIESIYGFARINPEEYARQKAEQKQRKIDVSRSIDLEQGKEIEPTDKNRRVKIAINKAASKREVNKFFNNATLLSRFMGLLSPLVFNMSFVDKPVSYNVESALLWAGERGIGPYETYTEAIPIGEDTIRRFKHNPYIRDLFTAMQLSRYNGDYETFILQLDRGEITPTQYLENIKNQGNTLEKWFRIVAKISTAEFFMRGKRAENWVRFYAKMAADEGHDWLREPATNSKGEPMQSALDALLDGNGDDYRVAQNVAGLFSGRIGAGEDKVAARALNLTLKADLAQDLAVSVIADTMIKKNGVINFGIAMTCTPFLKANIAFAHRALGHVMPCCTINYLLSTSLAENEKLNEINPNFKWEMDRARLYSSLREAAMMDIMNIGLPALAFLIGSAAFLEPPDDDDKWCNWEEWTILGQRVDTAWWISDVLGVALPIACFWRSATLGRPTPQLIMRGLSEVMMENPLNDVGELTDLVFDPNGYLESLEEGLQYYEDYPNGAPTGMEAFFGTIPAITGSWFGKLFTPSIIREISRLYPQYEATYNQIWEESDTGALTAEGAEGKTQKTTFADAQLRKVSRNNWVLGALLDLLPLDTQTSYIGSKMPRQRVYDQNQMNFATQFSVVDEDGNYKSAEEQEQVVGEIILMLQSSNDMTSLYNEGFYLNSQTREACSKYIWDMYHELTNQWETMRKDGELDFYVLGDGDYNEGQKIYGEMKLAYDQSKQNLQSLYYDKLWSKELNKGLIVYNRYNTTWRQDANGNWYASGVEQGLGGLFNPLEVAPGSLSNPGNTTGYEGDWGTPSAVTGQSMYDENGNAMRALIPTINNDLEVPSLDSWSDTRNNGYSSNYGTVYNTGTTSTNNDTGSTGNTTGSTSYPNRGTSGGRRYSSGGGGGGGSAPYSHVSAYGPNNNSIKQSAPNDGTRIYETNLDYLRPSFETKGSREAYRREDL